MLGPRRTEPIPRTIDTPCRAGCEGSNHNPELVIEFILELLLQLVLEILGQIIFEFATAFGWETLRDSVRREREARPVLAAIGHFFMGLLAGALSLVVFGHRLIERAVFPGVSLVASPLGTGLAMHWLGEFWREQGKDRPALFTFRAGAIFAFGMALVRFLYLERQSF